MGLNKQFLATTGISEMWDLSSENILFLGPWCLLDRENRKLVKDRHYSVVSSPWLFPGKIKDAAEYTQHIYNETLPVISERLNQLHGVSYPNQYWQILLGPWLLHFIEVLYERYSRIQNALDLFPNFYTHVLPDKICSLQSFNTYDFLFINGKVSQDWYNLKLLSLVIRDLCPDKGVSMESGFVHQENSCYYKVSRKRMIISNIKRVIDLFSNNRIILSDMYNLSYAQIIWLELKLNISVRDLLPRKKYPFNGADFINFRKFLRFNTASSDNFLNFLHETLPFAIPLVFIEHYKDYSRRAKVNNPVKIIGSAVGWYFNEEFKFFAAEAAKQGAKTVEFQHGGGYGMSSSVPSEFMALKKDVFYTWGWGIEKDEKVKALPSSYLSRLKNSAKTKGDEFLFIGTSTHRYVSMFCNYLFPDNMQKYFSDKKIFFELLSKKVLKQIAYRPYAEVGWQEIDRVKEFIPDVKFCRCKVLVNKMKKAKVVVIDHLSTTFLEALTINVPTILFWDHTVNVLRLEAEPYFDFLKQAGILFKTPQEAAKKVNEISEDPLKWWLSKETQELKDKFCQHFALTSKDWVNVWKNEFRNYL